LHDEFLPNTPFDAGAIIKAIGQSYYDSKTRQWVKQSVHQFGNQFASKLSAWPSDMPYPHDFLVIFWQNLDAAIHQEAETMLPTPYVPPTKPANEHNHQADEHLQLIKHVALSLEQKISNVVTQVHGQINQYTHSGLVCFADEYGLPLQSIQEAPADPMGMVTSSSAFTAALQVLDMTNVQEWTKAGSMAGSGAIEEDGFYPAPSPKVMDDVETAPFPYHPGVFSASPKIMDVNTACEVVCSQALVMKSAAEQAIVWAQGGTGGNRGPCWGCNGLPLYQANSFSHIWTDCPHKTVLEVRQNAQKNLKQFLLNRKSVSTSNKDQKLAACNNVGSDIHTVLCNHVEELKTKWEDEGHPSYEKAALLVSIVDPTTEKKVHQVCYQALTRGVKHGAREADSISAKMSPGSTPGTNHPVARM
jgi:hypothetical protein